MDSKPVTKQFRQSANDLYVNHNGVDSSMKQDLYSELIFKKINKRLLDFVCVSQRHVNEFWQSCDREELFIYAEKSRERGDEETYEKLMAIKRKKEQEIHESK
jgi:hypothetical protein